MKILLAPSESKRSGGEEPFELCRLLFDELCPLRKELLEIYREILQRGDPEELHRIFGLKKESQIEHYRQIDPLHSGGMKAILRYEGVAFDYLDYESLDEKARGYIDANVILFSNLFGPVLASDLLPEYRLKQGAPLGQVQTDRRYREAAAPLLDALLEGEEILDLRAGYYDRFYKPAHPYTTMKFLIQGKSVSHWAKAWRGRVAREAALHEVETTQQLTALPLPGMRLLEIQRRKLRTELIYEVEPDALAQ